MLQWTEQFTTGMGHLDYQHQALIDNINRLETLLVSQGSRPEDYLFMMNVVDFLEFYAQSHFKVEEQCMESFRCPVHGKNKQAHAQFLAFFDDFKEQCKLNGFRREFIENLHETVSGWITDHILRVDTQLRPCIKGGTSQTKTTAG
jgi:hemerythrin